MRPAALILPGLSVPPGAWSTWTLDPAAVATALAGVVYLRGVVTLRAKPRPPVSGRQALSFAAGLLLLAVALTSPLDAASTTLLSAHMLQHLLLLVAAPPLLVYGRPGLVLSLGLPRRLRRELTRIEQDPRIRPGLRLLHNPLALVGVTAAAMWAWHLPAAYQLALRNPTVHALEHLTFLISALAFWGAVIDPSPHRRLGYAPGMLVVFGVMLESAALGAIIAFSRALLYPTYRAGAAMWGVSALGDQQLAGAMMWIPPGILYLITIVVLARRWFDEMEKRMRRSEATLLPAAGGPR